MFFDNGTSAGFVMTKKRVTNLLVSLAGFIVFLLLPIDPYLKKTLAVLFLFIWQLATACLPTIVAVMIMAVLTIGLNLVNANAFLTAFGTSPFIMVMCLLFLAEGAKSTKFSQRISYFMIYKLGTSPTRLCLAFMLSTAFLSMFIADIPATLLMMAVIVAVLEEAGEEKGGKLGKALSITATWGSVIGGAALMSGSGINVTGINMLEKATEGQFSVSFMQWAALGIPFAFIVCFPAWWVLCKCFKLKEYKIKDIPKEEIKKKLDDLGPLDPGEKRFLTIMIITLLLFATSTWTGLKLPHISMIAMLLSICPVIGMVDFKKASKAVPWDTLILIGVTVAFSGAIMQSGLGNMIVENLLGWTAGYPMWFVVGFVALAGLLLHFPFTANPNGAIAVYIAALIPLATTVFNVNPGLLIMPAMLTGTTAFDNPIGTSYFLVQGFGYSGMKDSFVPGLVLIIPWVIILTVLSLIILPMVGLA